MSANPTAALADPLPSTDSAGLLTLFARFPGTMRSSDFPASCMSGVWGVPFPDRSADPSATDDVGISRFPCEEFPRMRRVFDVRGVRGRLAGGAGLGVAFRFRKQRRHSGLPDCAAQWLACVCPCQRFAAGPATVSA